MNNEIDSNQGQDVPQEPAETSGLPTWLAKAVSGTPPRNDSDDLDEESFFEQFRPEGECPEEIPNGSDEKGSEIRDDPPPAERLDYAPSRHELVQLARYWIREDLTFSVDYYLFGFTSCSQSKLVAHGGDRLRQLDKVLGDEAIEKAVKQVEDEYRYSLGDRIWEFFTKGSRSELRAVQDELRDGTIYGRGIAWRAFPQGLLPSDVGAVDCAPETWQEFGAFCNASGLRKKLAEQVRALWEEFSGRREDAGEP